MSTPIECFINVSEGKLELPIHHSFNTSLDCDKHSRRLFESGLLMIWLGIPTFWIPQYQSINIYLHYRYQQWKNYKLPSLLHTFSRIIFLFFSSPTHRFKSPHLLLDTDNAWKHWCRRCVALPSHRPSSTNDHLVRWGQHVWHGKRDCARQSQVYCSSIGWFAYTKHYFR